MLKAVMNVKTEDKVNNLNLLNHIKVSRRHIRPNWNSTLYFVGYMKSLILEPMSYLITRIKCFFVLFQILSGNTNTYLPVFQDLELPFVASRVRFIPYSEHPRTVCMRVEIYGCPWERKCLYISSSS